MSDLRTSLYDAHIRHGGKMVPFAGWVMPIQYQGILDEARAVRTGCGLFDVSHMARGWFRGDRVFDYLSSLVPSDLGRLSDRSAMYTILTNPNGGVIDDIIVYRLSASEYMIVFNAANREKDLAWFHQHGQGIDIDDRTLSTAMIAVQGPKAIETLAALGGTNLPDVPRFGAAETTIAGVRLLAGRTGYTGEDGFELICPADQADALWEALTQQGGVPCGLGARDLLRIEAGLHLYGHELSDEINPIEANLGWVVHRLQDYIGAEVVARVKAEGPSRKLMGIVMDDRAVPREGNEIWSDDQRIGTVSSGTFSPVLGKSIGMAFIAADFAKAGNRCEMRVRDRAFGATITTRRFLKDQ